jgi:hypothetical protein
MNGSLETFDELPIQRPLQVADEIISIPELCINGASALTIIATIAPRSRLPGSIMGLNVTLLAANRERSARGSAMNFVRVGF